MFRKSIKWKLILPMLIILLAIQLISAIALSNFFYIYNDKIHNDKINISISGLKTELEVKKNNTAAAASALSRDTEFVQAVKDNNREKIMKLLNGKAELFQISYFTVTDTFGNVLYRTHSSEKYGDSVLEQQNIKNALNGKTATYYEQGIEAKIAVRTGTPIYDENGVLVGVVSAGYRLDSDEYVDNLKAVYGVEATLFLNNIRINTTIIQNGKRITGTELNSSIAKAVIDDKLEYIEDIIVLGEPYKSTYLPIKDSQGNVFAIIFIGTPTKSVTDETSEFMIIMIIIGLLSLLAGGGIFYLIITKIVRPIISVTEILKNLANGELSNELKISSHDEIGSLANSANAVTASIRTLNEEIIIKTQNYIEGHSGMPIPEDKFKGKYQEIAKGVNSMSDIVNKDIRAILNCCAEISNGNFDAELYQLPGEHAIANQTIDAIKNNLKRLSIEIERLASDIMLGELSSRIFSEKYNGHWKTLTDNLNELLDYVTSPYKDIIASLTEVSNGNMSSEITSSYQGEYKAIKEVYNNTVKMLSSYINEISGTLNEMANDNFRLSITRPYAGDFEAIKNSLNKVITVFNKVLAEISESTAQIFTGANQIANSSTILAKGASEQTVAVTSLEKTMNDVSGKIIKIAEKSTSAGKMAVQANQSLIDGRHNMKLMVEAMNNISESSNSISEIMKVIDDIAFQTNLLALNAAVEAARASENGRGFSVVANHVRALAQKSQESSQEIAALIESTIEKINTGVSIVKKTSTDLDKISTDIVAVTDIVVEISEDASEQVANIEANSKNLTAITDSTVNNSAASEENATSSEELTALAESFTNTVKRFKFMKL